MCLSVCLSQRGWLDVQNLSLPLSLSLSVALIWPKGLARRWKSVSPSVSKSVFVALIWPKRLVRRSKPFSRYVFKSAFVALIWPKRLAQRSKSFCLRTVVGPALVILRIKWISKVPKAASVRPSSKQNPKLLQQKYVENQPVFQSTIFVFGAQRSRLSRGLRLILRFRTNTHDVLRRWPQQWKLQAMTTWQTLPRRITTQPPQPLQQTPHPHQSHQPHQPCLSPLTGGLVAPELGKGRPSARKLPPTTRCVVCVKIGRGPITSGRWAASRARRSSAGTPSDRRWAQREKGGQVRLWIWYLILCDRMVCLFVCWLVFWAQSTARGYIRVVMVCYDAMYDMIWSIWYIWYDIQSKHSGYKPLWCDKYSD